MDLEEGPVDEVRIQNPMDSSLDVPQPHVARRPRDVIRDEEQPVRTVRAHCAECDSDVTHGEDAEEGEFLARGHLKFPAENGGE
jgi:hypothetical protein